MRNVFFVLGCGPSLAHLDVDLAPYGRVIATNDAVFKYPRADALYFTDLSWWIDNRFLVRRQYQGPIYTSNKLVEEFYVTKVPCSGASGLDISRRSIRHGSNSGYAALHLAFNFGATLIVLLGFDMQTVNGNAHWQRRPKESPVQDRIMKNVMLPRFNELVGPLARLGVDVINATPNSALRVWPHVPLSTVLSWL